ncbi:hypothetical protein N657DRAFT_700227 [Parathielavia appendiculata]|uniref:Uncharacterized protein n=1 Tax=Parathielavia appendiculata TaxID=2587402 RepID=A0AAN6TUF2_9PEZI|nr:hypothetical protein N657DRAFT_700227 [Parathielavia appendiculata]
MHVARRRELVIGTRGRKMKIWFNYSIILLSAVQLVLAAVVTAEKRRVYWEIIGPVSSGIIAASTRPFTSLSIWGFGYNGCTSPHFGNSVASLSCVISILFVRPCIEVHRIRTSSAPIITPESVPTSDDRAYDGNRAELAGVPKQANNASIPTPSAHGTPEENLAELAGVVPRQADVPVVIPLTLASQTGGTTDVYMIAGPDGRPQLLVSAGIKLMAVPADGQRPVAAAEAASTPIYEV